MSSIIPNELQLFSVSLLRGVGKQTAKHLARLEIYSIPDLLLHLPLRYQDRTHVETIRQARIGNETVIEGVISRVFAGSGRTQLLCQLSDETGVMYLRFFHVLPFQLEKLKVGQRLRCYSEVRIGPKGLEMVHPEFQILLAGEDIALEQYFTPIYPATEGMTQYLFRKLMANALVWMEKHAIFSELIPPSLLQSLSFPTLQEALLFVHKPPRTTPILQLQEGKTLAHQRLVFEELLTHRLSLLQVKQIFQTQKSVPLVKHATLSQQLRAHLPFQLTTAQEKVIAEINADLMRPHPMLRLVQGDVGSGKTVVAALVMLEVVENNYQAALMAPTELLAEQHYRVFKRWFASLPVQVVYLSGHVKGRARTAALKAIADGSAQIIIGTQALFQAHVNFSRLALLIVDEQHRFGVHQRALFREKGRHLEHYPHQLVMTATPIPRTLAMSFYADLDCSIINELPPGRSKIETRVIVNTRREEVVVRIREVCQQGRQAYWVCPLIEESEVMSCQAATKTAETLQALLPQLKIGLVHGRLSASAKEAVMQDFQQGLIHLLVATTVIEVGVDVPNASLMIIENAERLGLSQLHQLRGRVGRGTVASHCVLFYQLPLSELAKARLGVMRETTDGFRIAQRDLELRGPGEVLGTRQTGELSFRVADLLRDSAMLSPVTKAAEWMLQHHSVGIAPLIKRWIGNGNEYGKV